MEITIGLVLLGTGALGSIVCIVLLFIMEKSWKKQRTKMLREIEKEDW